MHTEIIRHAIQNNLHVFVEKPLAVTEEQLNKVINAYKKRMNISREEISDMMKKTTLLHMEG